MSAINSHIAILKQEDTKRIACMLAREVTAGDCLALSGEVGAGKTTMAQHFIQQLLVRPETITSPTFTIMQRYEGKGGFQIIHADLYRLKNESELLELGLEELFTHHVTLVEWPEIARALLPDNTLYLQLEYVSEDSRSLAMHSNSVRWRHFLRDAA